jgi:hypothetical protein
MNEKKNSPNKSKTRAPGSGRVTQSNQQVSGSSTLPETSVSGYEGDEFAGRDLYGPNPTLLPEATLEELRTGTEHKSQTNLRFVGLQLPAWSKTALWAGLGVSAIAGIGYAAYWYLSNEKNQGALRANGHPSTRRASDLANNSGLNSERAIGSAYTVSDYGTVFRAE